MARTFVGIDLTAGLRPTAVAALSDDLSVSTVAMLATDADLLEFANRFQAATVAIDAPLGFPAGQCCLEASCQCAPTGPDSGRECERALSRLGIGCYYTTKRSIIKAMVYRGLALKAALEARGCAVLEVYPYATKVRLFGRPLPRKSTPAGRQHVSARLGALLGRDIGQLTHDEADAILCAYTAWLQDRGRTEALGNLAEGQIHLPAILDEHP